MAEYKVPLWQSPQRCIKVNPEATKGATVGVNVYNQDGTLFVPAAPSATPQVGNVSVTLWSLVQEIPENVVAVAGLATNGFVRKAGAVWSASPIVNADLPDMAAGTIKARKTGSTGDPEDCTLSEVLDLVGSAADGDILMRASGAWTRLAAGTNGHVLTLASGAPSWAASGGGGSAGPGAQVNFAYAQTSTPVSTTDTSIPIDNTIPQITEGVAWAALDTTITPTAASSKLKVTLSIPMISPSASQAVTMAVFRDSGANAVWATLFTEPVAGQTFPHTFTFVVDAGSTSATTFKVRWCVSGGTGYMLRTSTTAALYNGVMVAIMHVAEIKQ